ncbi:creatininase family protein [Streptomyces litchfieldiae]|uniref:Creatininase family protein n=1 Tax=Streptomyces litchfieldiae TaxID=3075543 RepID=A0ABU2MLI5_9ACTN|nr:creatininase family protein [Streptomyces sp. DSM 44938]MDT0342345.1 creatininase family protein [Streptomyces sp. DSM 44938]
MDGSWRSPARRAALRSRARRRSPGVPQRPWRLSPLEAAGVPGLLIVNGHGGNYVLSNVVQELNVAGPHIALFPASEDRRRARADAELVSRADEDMHGGEFEVSLLLHGAPEAVGDGIADEDHSAPDRLHLLTLGMAGYTTNGIIGQPSLATAAKGKALLDSFSHSARAHLALISEPREPHASIQS